ncbi:MAG: hypothetical protein J7L55_03695 [Desulfurococcales archaeon]|nr:hypothetical protein [Desulfurococcales archaeon]
MSLIRSPVDTLAKILEVLAENSCVMRDSDLYEVLRKEHPDLSFSDLIRYLMILEIRGFIHVSSSRESVRIIRLSKYGKEQLRVQRC